MGSEESLLKKGYDTPLNIMTVIHLRGSLVKFVFDRYEADFQKGTTHPPKKPVSRFCNVLCLEIGVAPPLLLN